MTTPSNQLILTGGDDTNEISFYILDIEKKAIVCKKAKTIELESLPPEKGRPLFRPFGISIDNKNIYIASNDKIGLFDKKSYDFIGCLDIPAFVNTHQILKHENLLFVCHTAINCIGIHDLQKHTNKFVKLPEGKILNELPIVNDVYEHDSVHLNSLLLERNRLFFCLHYRAQRKSRYGYYDLDTEKVSFLFDAGMCGHNIKIVDNFLYTLSTQEGDLLEFDMNTKQIVNYKLVNPKKVFLRGLEKYKKGIIFCGSLLYDENIAEDVKDPFIGYFDIQNKSMDIICQLKEPKWITDCCWIHEP